MTGVLDGLGVESLEGESNVLKILLNTTNYEQTKILSEVPPDLVYQLSLMNVVRKRFSSTLLKQMCGEVYLHQAAKDRKARLEAVEISTAQRLSGGEED